MAEDISTVIEQLEQAKIRIKEYRPEDRQKLEDLEKSLKPALLMIEVSQNDGIKLLIEKYKQEIEVIDNQLKTDKRMRDIDRLLCFERKDWINEFIDYFKMNEAIVKSAEEIIKSVK